MTERRASEEEIRMLEAAGYELEILPTGERCWRDPGTGRMLSGDHAAELLRREEARALEEAGWQREEGEGETIWRRPDSGHLYPQSAAYDALRAGEDE